MPEEVKQEVVLKTQKYLGKYVKKPPLTEKLLKKPPFRFLHDIIHAVIIETGFLKGLYSEEELNSENVKEKDTKIAFLSKLIDAVKTITNTDLKVRPSKIIAGLEPTETNLLLQTIGKALDKKLDSSEYVNQLRSGQVTNSDKTKKSKKPEKTEKLRKPSKTSVTAEEKAKPTPRKNEKQAIPTSETPKSTDRSKTTRAASKGPKTKPDLDENKPKTKEKVKKKEKTKEESVKDKKHPEDKFTPKETLLEAVQENENLLQNEKEPTELIVDNLKGETVKSPIDSLVISTNEQNVENEVVRKRTPSASRPKSARPRSGDIIKDKSQESIIEVTTQPLQSRPRSSLRPPSVRPPSARPGAPRLRPDSGFPAKEMVPMGKINVIVENFDKDVDDEETVIIQTNPEIVEEHDEKIDVPGDNKGHLVEQILEQIGDSDAKGTTDKSDDWQRKDLTIKDTSNLRSIIQSLTKTANPLGKLLNYLHEDIDAMHAELESWTNTKRQLFNEIAKQKKVSAEMNKPLHAQLEQLNQEVKKMEEEIVSTRGNILRNDQKINELISK